MQIQWLETSAGQSLLLQEQQLAGRVLERVFGDQIVQIGNWGPPDIFLGQARTQFSVLLGDELLPGVGAMAAPQRLPVLTDSIDAVLLPHTLDISPDPHAVLREVHRVLRPDGKLIVLAFNPASWCGFRHTFAPSGFPPGVKRQIPARRLTDWLRLLNLDIESINGCYASTPASQAGKLLRRWHWFASAYVLVATKQTIPMTIIRPRVRRQTRLVGGLVNPSTRNVA